MVVRTILEAGDTVFTDTERKHIEGQLDALARRLGRHRNPTVTLVLTPHTGFREIDANLRVQLSPLGRHLVAHQHAEMPDHAVRLAVEDVERQLERVHAKQRGEPTFGVPSRRLPAQLRPNPPPRAGAGPPVAAGDLVR